ncbi:MAG: hypothetical protein KC800_06470 [Candidatus Eremiobacteraeota bacterium]|nr:hypothetical protein [Candidatus Eremiobacteraeota bacterium]
MLSFSPALSGLEILHSHRSTLESFGKKVDEKAKNLRSAEILFAAKKADWDAISELSQELKANSDTILILTEGLCESLFRAVKAFCSPVLPDPKGTRVEILSSALHGESLEALTRWIVGRKVSLVLVYQNTPSERLFWTFRVLLKALSQGRHPDEVHRRVIVSTGEAASSSESWAQRSPFRTISFPPRCASRYLFFCEPTALLLSLMDLTAWSYVEGGRSFFRQFDKKAEIEDPILAYAALREVQLAEHHRETLVLPDETYAPFGEWWKALTEDSRSLFAEESNDGLVWSGRVMKETATATRQHWVTEIAVESSHQLETTDDKQSNPPTELEKLSGWVELEHLYKKRVDQQREGKSYAQPWIRVGLRRRDPFCIGGIFCFFESVVAASHRLAETSDNFSLLKPHDLATSEVTA